MELAQAPAAAPPATPAAAPAATPSEATGRVARTRGQLMALPLAMGATAACGCAAVLAWNPGDDGVPLCWSRTVFGVDCPFCGGLRATNALLRGRLGEALDHNVVLAVALPVAVLMWVWWMVRAWRGIDGQAVEAPRWLWITAAVLLVAFAVVRNLPGTALTRWLHSDTYAG